jgi:hypothetical protein
MGFLSDIFGTKNKFNADKASLDTTAYAPAIAAGQAQGTDNSKFNNVFGQQQKLAGQYGQVAAGQGPNPAREMLRQQTGQNVNMAQGQAASQRGVNPALAARMAVDASAGQNQQAAGQGATMQAQQSLAAMGQQAGVLGQMQQGANTNQAVGNQVFGTAGTLQNQQNNANIANTLGTNQINAGVAAQNAATNAAMVGGLMDAAGGAMAMSDERVKTDIHRQQTEALPGVPEATFRYQGFPGQYRGVIAQDVQEERPDLVEEGQDGFLRVDPRLAPEKMARGGLIPGYTDGGMVPQAEMPEMNMDYGGLVPAMAGGGLAPEPVSPLHGYLDSLEAQVQPMPAPPQPQGLAQGGMPQPQPGFFMEEPSMAPAPVAPAPAPVAAPPAAAPAQKPKMTSFANLGAAGTNAYDRFAGMRMPQVQMSEGGPVPMSFVGGGNVPGQAQVQGDSQQNDIVPAYLSPGEAVVPRTVMQSDNPPAEAAAFIEHLLRRRGTGPSFDKAMAAHGGRKMAEGGEVKSGGAGQEGASPSLTAAVTGWWKSRGTPDQEAHGRNVDEALNALLPSLVSGRKALQAKRASLKAVDAQTQE